MSNLAVALLSGGLDSTTLAYYLRDEGYALRLLAVNYGQRHVKELACAEIAARRLDAQLDVLDLSCVGALLSGSALTDQSVAVPVGHYADPNMRLTVVPNRNMILLSIAYGVAVAEGAECVALAVHAGDHPIYPDCRPVFLKAFDAAAALANNGYCEPIKVYAPFVEITKAEIVRRGVALSVPYAETWSCYQGGDTHCGRCGTCIERREAFLEAGVNDPTEYQG